MATLVGEWVASSSFVEVNNLRWAKKGLPKPKKKVGGD